MRKPQFCDSGWHLGICILESFPDIMILFFFLPTQYPSSLLIIVLWFFPLDNLYLLVSCGWKWSISGLGTWLRPSQLACVTPVWPQWLVQGWAHNPRDPMNVKPKTCSETTEEEVLSFCWDYTLVDSKSGIVHFHCRHEERPYEERKPTQRRQLMTLFGHLDLSSPQTRSTPGCSNCMNQYFSSACHSELSIIFFF